MSGAKRFITQPMITAMINAGLILNATENSTITALQNIIDEHIAKLTFSYDQEKDLAFLKETASSLANMFFEERVVIAAKSYFANQRLGGTIDDATIRNVLEHVTTRTLLMLSEDYKIRLSLYIGGDMHIKEDLDTALTSYIYFYVKPMLVQKAIAYNETLSNRSPSIIG